MKIEEHLNNLNLYGMHRRWESLKENHDLMGLSLQEGLELLLQAEAELRADRKRERLIKGANFRYQASVNEISFLPGRNLDRTTIATLADCSFIDKGETISVTGATGCGKSYLASAIGQQACLMGYKTIYVSMSKLMAQLKQAKAQGSNIKYLDNLSKHKLLIIDDFGLSCLDRMQSLDFMEIIEDRHGKSSTILVSQLPMADWYDLITENTIADALMDRIIHSAIRIELKGESLRKKR